MNSMYSLICNENRPQTYYHTGPAINYPIWEAVCRPVCILVRDQIWYQIGDQVVRQIDDLLDLRAKLQ